MRLSIALANLKPGTGKTTTAVLLAYALHQRGHDVALADCDPAASALAWSDAVGGFPFGIYGLAVKDAGRRLAGIAGPETIVVADLPQAEDHGAIVRSVLRQVDEITIPVAPSTIEVERTSGIADLLDEGAEGRAEPARVGALLARAVASASSARHAREPLTHLGSEVSPSQIPPRAACAPASGAAPGLAGGGPVGPQAAAFLERAGTPCPPPAAARQRPGSRP